MNAHYISKNDSTFADSPSIRHPRFSDLIENVVLVMLILIVVRLVLYMMGADSAGAAGAIYWMTDIFSIPFQGLLPIISIGKYAIDLPAAMFGLCVVAGGSVIATAIDIYRMYRKNQREEDEIIIFPTEN